MYEYITNGPIKLNYGHLSPLKVISAVGLCLAVLLLSYSNGTFYPLILITVFFSIGVLILHIAGLANSEQLKAFVITFSLCLFFSGITQTYSFLLFNQLTQSDAKTFYLISSNLTNSLDWEVMRLVTDAPLASFLWNKVYKLAGFWGMDNGPWIGLIVNSFTMGLAASITVQIAEIIHGKEKAKIASVSFLFAFCPIFWLFGSIFLRDCFILLMNVILIYGIVKVLYKFSITNLCFAVIASIVAYFAYLNLRPEFAVTVPLVAILALIAWNRKTSGFSRAALGIFLMGSVTATIIVLNNPIYESIQSVSSQLIQFRQSYEEQINQKGLAYNLIIDRGILIRLIGGSIYLHVFPIPFWNGFNFDAQPYFWLKSLMALYMVYLTPRGLSGILISLKNNINGRDLSHLHIFITAYLIVGILMVVLSTLETRHYGIFIPYLILMSVVPNINNQNHKYLILSTTVLWIIFVVLVNSLWLTNSL